MSWHPCVCLSLCQQKKNMFQASYVAKVFQTSYLMQSILIRTFIVLGVSQCSSFCHYFQLLPNIGLFDSTPLKLQTPL